MVTVEKAKVAIVAAIGVHRENSVEKEVPQTSSSGFVDERASATGANGRTTTRKVELHTAPCFEDGQVFYS